MDQKCLFSDEMHFHLPVSGVVNSHNSCCCAENPLNIIEKPLRGKRCTAWCVHTSRGIVGLY